MAPDPVVGAALLLGSTGLFLAGVAALVWSLKSGCSAPAPPADVPPSAPASGLGIWNYSRTEYAPAAVDTGDDDGARPVDDADPEAHLPPSERWTE